MSQAMIVEYTIQNDQSEIIRNRNKNASQVSYPNMYILPKKYESINDVKIHEVLGAFPHRSEDLYHFRFETFIKHPQSGKKVMVYRDVVYNQFSDLNIPVPYLKDRIRIKALRIPKGIKKRQLPQIPQLARMYERPTVHSNNLGDAGSLLGQVNTENAQQLAQEGLNKLNSVAGKLQGVMGNFGAQFFGNQGQNPENPSQVVHADKLEFSDDGDEDAEWNAMKAEMGIPPKTGLQQEIPKQPMPEENPYSPPFAPPPKSDNTFNPPPQPKPAPAQAANTNLLFDLDMGSGSQVPPQQQQQPSTQANSFDLFNQEPSNVPEPQAPQMNSDFMTGLSDLNFNDFSEAPKQDEPEEAPQQQQSRTEEVKAFFQDEQKKREQWDDSQNRLVEGINRWIGVQNVPPGTPAYMQPKKNHIKVLLCTLHTVIWQGSNWQIIGMDKLQDNNQVKKYYRKAMMMCHPDKVNNDPDPDKIFIANRCFAALNEAFNEFKNEPGVNIS